MHEIRQDCKDEAMKMSQAFIDAQNEKMRGKTQKEREALLNIILNSLFHSFGAIFHSVGIGVQRQLAEGMRAQCGMVCGWLAQQEELQRLKEAHDGQ